MKCTESRELRDLSMNQLNAQSYLNSTRNYTALKNKFYPKSK